VQKETFLIVSVYEEEIFMSIKIEQKQLYGALISREIHYIKSAILKDVSVEISGKLFFNKMLIKTSLMCDNCFTRKHFD
jgi:hypothetical protein